MQIPKTMVVENGDFSQIMNRIFCVYKWMIWFCMY